jgi:probable O-glycosylation ligase (exosortase A-associated)
MASLSDAASPPGISIPAPSSRTPFYLVLGYLFFEFARPQALFPPLEALHLPAIIILLLSLSLLRLYPALWGNRQTRLFVPLFILMAFHIPTATNNFFALKVAQWLFMFFVTYLSVIMFVDSFQKFNTLIHLWLIIHAFLAINGTLKGGRGVGGFLGDENDLCLVLNMAIPYPFFLGLSEKNPWKKMLYFGMVFLLLLAIISTGSRGGFVGLLTIAGYCWLKSSQKIVTALFISFLAVFMLLFAPASYWNEMRTITRDGSERGTGEQRVYSWKIGWLIFLDNPIFGGGQGNFSFVFGKYEKESGNTEGFHGRSRAGRAAHSVYFTLLPELGMVGTFIVGAMAYATYKNLGFCRRFSSALPRGRTRQGSYPTLAWSYAMEASMAAYLVTGIFISVLYYPCFWVLMGFIVALQRIISRHLAEPAPP